VKFARGLKAGSGAFFVTCCHLTAPGKEADYEDQQGVSKDARRGRITADEPDVVYALDRRGADEIALGLGNDRGAVLAGAEDTVGLLDRAMALSDDPIAG